MAGTKTFNGVWYNYYTNFTGTGKGSRGGKRQAEVEANRLRKTNGWLARLVKSPYGGYDIYVKPKGGK